MPLDCTDAFEFIKHRAGRGVAAVAADKFGEGRALAFEGEVIELSWYGDAPVPVHLGGAFHSRRLAIRASQVGE